MLGDLSNSKTNSFLSLMISYLFLAARTILLFGARLILSIPSEGWRYAPKRALLFVLLWCGFVLLSALHLVGFLMDEILFHDFRKVKVTCPVFVVGIPRSGTTFLQRVLAQDSGFTTFTTWEALFAPSISERFFYRFLGSLLTPLRKLAAMLRHRFLARMDTIHPLGLDKAEEDFLLLIWIDACLLQAFLCPGSNTYWNYGRFDDKVNPADAQRTLSWYRQCLQRHLYYHGQDRRMLSKNPSFTSMISTLRGVFPGASFIACYRDPVETVPSQLSAMSPAMSLLGSGRLSPETQKKTIALLIHYYHVIYTNMGQHGFIGLPMASLTNTLQNTVCMLYQKINQPMSESFSEALSRQANKARVYRSRHQYEPEDFGLSDDTILQMFAPVWPLKNPENSRLA